MEYHKGVELEFHYFPCCKATLRRGMDGIPRDARSRGQERMEVSSDPIRKRDD